MHTCLDVLRDRFGIDHPTFAFPFGALDAEMIEIAKQVGVACCLSTENRPVGPGDNEFHWGRFNVEASDTVATLAAKLSGWYTTVAALRRKLTRPLKAVARAAVRTGRSSPPAISYADTSDAGRMLS
jgi:hypothetical protein